MSEPQNPNPAPTLAERLGTPLDGEYRLVRLIGKGGMGSVYEAEHTLIKRQVAIKLLHVEHAGSEVASERFLREAQSAAAIGHPNIINIQDVGKTPDGIIYMVMERLHGRSLAKVIEKSGRIDSKRAVDILLPVLSACKAAHEKGIIHRDLKPDNIFVTYDEDRGEDVKLLDFGISKIADAEVGSLSLTKTGTVLGTPFYMSPEQAAGEKDIDQRIDIWAAGVILFEMLTGTLPYAGDSYNAVLARILTKPVPDIKALVPELPDVLVRVVERALAKDRDERYSTMLEMMRDLRALTGVLSSAALLASDPALMSTFASDETPAVRVVQQTPEALLAGATTFADGKSPELDSEDSKAISIERARTPAPLMLTPPQGRTPTLDIQEHGRHWKLVMWFAITLPLAWIPAFLAMGVSETTLFTMLGLPSRLPNTLVMVIIVALCLVLSGVSFLIMRFWRAGKWNHWLQGPRFVVVPAIGLGLSLFNYLQLSGLQESQTISLRSYNPVDASGAKNIVDAVGSSIERFLLATSLDQLVVWLISTMVLLGYLFVRPVGASAPNARRRWALLPAGILFIVAMELFFFPGFTKGGFFRLPLYLTWALTAAAVLRVREPLGDGFLVAWQTLRAGILSGVAITGAGISIGFYFFFRRVEELSLGSLSAEDRGPELLASAKPFLVAATLGQWLMMLVLFGALYSVCRPAFPVRQVLRPRLRAVGAAFAIVAITSFPIWVLGITLDDLADLWLPYKLGSMEPVALEAGAAPSFYIDRNPVSLYESRRTFFSTLTDEARDDYTVDGLLEALAAGSSEGPCPGLLAQSLDEVAKAPALCISGIEAQLFCESRRMRLPTPAQWEAALSTLSPTSPTEAKNPRLLRRGEAAEWTMELQNDKESYALRGSASPRELAAGSYAPDVGFRCVFTFE